MPQVEALIEFPSHHFYGGSLTTSSLALNLVPAPSIPWPGNSGFPSVFLQITGIEKKADISKNQEDNIYNEQEASYVVSSGKS